MQSTPNPQQTDPHDVFVIEPGVSLAARADKAPLDVLYDVLRDHSQPRHADIERLDIKPSDVRLSNPAAAESELRIAPDFSAGSEGSPIPDANGIKLGETEISTHQPAPGKLARGVVMGLFALGSAVCAAAWQHYGDDAKTVLAQWAPTFALASTPPLEKPAAAAQAAIQAAVPDQASAQSPSSVQAVANAVPEPSQALQSMARDLAAMGQQISELKATIEQLKANQAQASQLQPTQAPVLPREPVRTEARLTEPTAPLVRPRIVMPPAHATAAPIRKPKQVFPYAPITPASPPAAAAPVSQTAVGPAQAASLPQTAEDGGPVVRPPLPLH
ncbi:MAG: hypothetical protein K2X57_20525 [Xanthobacteraceae bacterium]|nr:hypothetical protein [Xanthobacteraceae bacterium]